jgi:hypothetical protein
MKNEIHTAKFSEACHIRVRDNLSMLKARSQGSDIDTLQRRFKCIENKSICSITDSMNVLEVVLGL